MGMLATIDQETIETLDQMRIELSVKLAACIYYRPKIFQEIEQ